MHEAGPFETWDMLGVRETVACYERKWLSLLPSGCQKCWQLELKLFMNIKAISKVAVYDVSKKKYVKIEQTPGLIFLSELKEDKKVINSNAGASLYDIGDGVALVEFHTKMNALDDDIFNITLEALDRTENEFEGLVIGNEGDHFSAGANLFMVVVAAQQGMWDVLDQASFKITGHEYAYALFPQTGCDCTGRYGIGWWM